MKKVSLLLCLALMCSSTVIFAQKKKKMKAETSMSTSSSTDYQAVIKEAYEMFKNVKDGKNADYIPYLAKVNSDMYGIALVTADGHVYEVGETKYEFGIESIEKVFSLCMATKNNTEQDILTKVGANQTGLPFNSVMAIELEGKWPMNPLVNAGAMATTSLITKNQTGDKWTAIDQFFDKCAGRDIKVIDELYRSEAETNQHNVAIAWLLKSYDHMYDDPATACDIYTKQCSFGVNAKDLAVMAGLLANGGVNPVTKERIIEEKWVTKVLAVMGTTGLYETTGDWMFSVGLPSKSGVGGGIISVCPGQYAIAVFSPPLDKAGNSVRAQKAITYVAQKLNSNVYNPR